MSLKDDIAADLETFFDVAEFGEEHTVEGRKIICILDTCRSQALSGGAEKGLSEADYVLHAKTADLPKRKPAGQLLRIDGRDFEVAKWDEEDGASVVELYSPESQ